jgi:serine/threonine-protein kinase HipA
MATKKITAYLNLNNLKIKIGEMVENQSKIYFKYDLDFIAKGIEISPFKLKLSNEILTPKETHFDGLFGVFSDSIPDGWGKLLLDRKLLSLRIPQFQINALDRLTFIDSNGMGAISYEPEYENNSSNTFKIDLDQISDEVESVLKGSFDDIIEELYLLGGSSGGARPKILVGYNPATEEIIPNRLNLPEGFEHWIIKFPATSDLTDIALIEYTYNMIAKNAGIEISECKLFKSKKGNYFFGSKRFDRIGNQRLHLHSVAGLLHDNFRMSTLDYGHIMDCAFKLEKQFSSYEKILKLAAFNVFAHNRDDHSKNFSFLMNEKGDWKFAPAYDLTFSQSSYGFHSTTIAGESKNPSLDHLNKLAKHFGVKNSNQIFESVKDAVSQFENIGKNIGITKASTELIKKHLK